MRMVARSGPSCVTWGYRPHNHGRKPEAPCQPRTWTTGPTYSSGTPAADRPGKKLCGDITYVRTWAGFIYLATVLDC